MKSDGWTDNSQKSQSFASNKQQQQKKEILWHNHRTLKTPYMSCSKNISDKYTIKSHTRSNPDTA